ncbi:hypothetical protein V8C86DRAFT_2557844 [Haematococcus lacustris]
MGMPTEEELEVKRQHRAERKLHSNWVPHVSALARLVQSGAHSTCYEILGIGIMATPEQIRSAYLRMASKTHPDRGGNAEDFMKVQAAFDTLYHIARQRSSQLVP